MTKALVNRIIRDGKRREKADPRAVSARYDRANDLILIELQSGAFIGFRRTYMRALRTATRTQIEHMAIGGLGSVVEWPDVDDGLDILDFIEHVVGCRTAPSTGREGGLKRSKRKTVAARANGAKGGRPRKKAA